MCSMSVASPAFSQSGDGNDFKALYNIHNPGYSIHVITCDLFKTVLHLLCTLAHRSQDIMIVFLSTSFLSICADVVTFIKRGFP
jgi:hypothetical protein